jgi:glycosyltransferase involved in cell wall biosynthesis
MSELAVSVVVPVRNGRGHLEKLILALEAQTLGRDRFEVIVADDGSTDGSTDGLETLDGWLRVLWGPPRNAYAARNRAARAAQAPALAFCDADCQPEPDWLEAGLQALERAEVAAGLIRFIVPKRRTIWTLIDIDTTKDHEREVQIGNAETANLFVHRDFFERLDGFDESSNDYGDFDFALRSVRGGGRLVFAPDAAVWHPTRNTPRPFLRMVWNSHRSYAAREARNGGRPLGLRLRWWVPVLPHVHWRKQSGRSLGLDRHWLTQNGVSPRLWDDLRALPLMYLLMPYLAGVAQLRGWLDGRRLR